MDAKLQGYIDKLNKLNFKEMYNGDFFLTWEKTDDEIEAVFHSWLMLCATCERTTFPQRSSRAAWASPYSVTTPPVPVSLSLPLVTCLVLRFRIWTRARAQVAHGETVRETANMISFMADVIGIRDDMYIGKGNKYMHEVVDAVTRGTTRTASWSRNLPWSTYSAISTTRPSAMADMLHIIHDIRRR